MIFKLLWIFVLAHIGITWVLAIRRGWRARKNDAPQPRPPIEDLPPVSVIVPAWNEKGTIEQSIAALRQVIYPCWEAIVLAGGTDGTYATAAEAVAGDDRFRLLERGPEPKNEALMRGVHAARYDTLVLLDADSVVFPHWLAALVEPLSHGAGASLGERLPKRLTWVTQAEQMQNIQAYHIFGSTSIQGDRSLAIKRDVLAQMGELPAHTYAREDWDLGIRLKVLGIRVAFAPQARLQADRPATLYEYWHNEVRWRRTHLNGVWEHRDFFWRHPTQALFQLYVYGLSLVLGLGLVAGVAAVLFRPSDLPVLLQVVAMLVVWLGGRRAALGGEAAVYTGEISWLGRLWGPVVLMFVSFAASIAALLSMGSGTPFDYKGPRHLYTA